MHPKITSRALKKLVCKEADELVSLQVRITTPFTSDEIQMINTRGGTLLFDSGIVAVVRIPACKVIELAEAVNVMEIN